MCLPYLKNQLTPEALSRPMTNLSTVKMCSSNTVIYSNLLVKNGHHDSKTRLECHNVYPKLFPTTATMTYLRSTYNLRCYIYGVDRLEGMLTSTERIPTSKLNTSNTIPMTWPLNIPPYLSIQTLFIVVE